MLEMIFGTVKEKMMSGKLISSFRSLVLLALISLPLYGAKAEPADIVYRNGKIYTVDNDNSWASAVAIKDGAFIAVADDNEIAQYVGNATRVIDLDGRFVLPGLHDAHTHMENVGKQRKIWCNVSPESPPESFLDALAACARELPEGKWLVASSYGPANFPERKVDRSFLDSRFPERPVFLVEQSWHHGMTNSAGLVHAGIDRETADPAAGHLVRDATGRLTGELLEEATSLVKKHIPPVELNELVSAVEWIADMHNRSGITSVQDALTTEALLKALNVMDRQGRLPLHVAAHIAWGNEAYTESDSADVETLIQNRQSYATSHVDPDNIKIVVDGSPMPPHSNHVNLDADGDIPAGKLLISPANLKDAVTRFDSMGMKVKMHAVGSGAARAALDAIEAARMRNGSSGIMHELSHSVWYAESDIARFHDLNAVSEFSPAIWHHNWPGMEEAFNFKALNEAGSLIIAGTDWVILDTPDLFPGLEGMVTRQGLNVDLPTGIRILTINGAMAVGKASLFGSIEPGKSADMVILDRNLFEIPAEQISETRVIATVFEGKEVYRRPQEY